MYAHLLHHNLHLPECGDRCATGCRRHQFLMELQQPLFNKPIRHTSVALAVSA